ncbi:MAG: VOC family protein [Candidatus Obscuribacterales bacterium]|nr:VOC family protein [Candidatus Obscuribacterales bacterium]
MSTASAVKLGSLSYVIVYVKDTEVSKKFYKELLGMTIKDDQPGWVEFKTGETTLAIHSDNDLAKKGTPGRVVNVFSVEDIHASYEALKKSGVKFFKAPETVCEIDANTIGVSADFTDPDGNILSIFGLVAKK